MISKLNDFFRVYSHDGVLTQIRVETSVRGVSRDGNKMASGRCDVPEAGGQLRGGNEQAAAHKHAAVRDA
jgi:hypothetical protein